VRALAVSGEARAAALPDVPTFRESGFALEESTWFGLFAPKGTPAAIIDKVNADVTAVLAEPDMRARGAQLGFRYIGGAPAQLGQHLRAEIAKWADVAKNADLSGH
jgi:tripartite-type tricarboxylate transporter receptor subunit TctC